MDTHNLNQTIITFRNTEHAAAASIIMEKALRGDRIRWVTDLKVELTATKAAIFALMSETGGKIEQ